MRLSPRTLVLAGTAAALLVAAPIVVAAPSGGDAKKTASDRGLDHRDDRKSRDHAGPRWALVDENGTIVQQTGGFRTVDCFQTNANCYLDIGQDARSQGLAATIAGQNAVAGQAVSLTGEVAVGACGLDTLNCAPPGTEDREVIVVTPRNSDGSETAPGARKRFYVQVLGAAYRS